MPFEHQPPYCGRTSPRWRGTPAVVFAREAIGDARWSTLISASGHRFADGEIRDRIVTLSIRRESAPSETTSSSRNREKENANAA